MVKHRAKRSKHIRGTKKTKSSYQERSNSNSITASRPECFLVGVGDLADASWPGGYSNGSAAVRRTSCAATPLYGTVTLFRTVLSLWTSTLVFSLCHILSDMLFQRSRLRIARTKIYENTGVSSLSTKSNRPISSAVMVPDFSQSLLDLLMTTVLCYLI